MQTDDDDGSVSSELDGSVCLSSHSHSESSQPSSQEREDANVKVEEGDALYHELRASLRPQQPPALVHSAAATISSSWPLHLQAELWPLLCDVFSQAQRSHSSGDSSLPPSALSSSYSFLRLLTAHAELSESACWSAAVAERLLSFLLQLHRLSRHLGRPDVHWQRLLHSAYIHQCRHDAALRADRRLQQAMEQEDDGLREEKAQPVQQTKAARSSAGRRSRHHEQLQLSDGERQAGRFGPQQRLLICFRVWRRFTVSERPSPLIVALAERLELQLHWRRWQQAWRGSRAERVLASRSREKLAAAILHWQTWTQRSSEQRALVQRAQQFVAAAVKSRCMKAWHAACLERGEEDQRQHIAARHYEQSALPAALELWLRRTQARRRGRLAAQQADDWRRRTLAAAALAAWTARRAAAALYCQEATARLLPMRLRAGLLQWQRAVRQLQSSCISSPLLLHGLFSWLSVSQSLPAPLLPSSSPVPQSVRPYRRQQHAQMQGRMEALDDDAAVARLEAARERAERGEDGSSARAAGGRQTAAAGGLARLALRAEAAGELEAAEAATRALELAAGDRAAEAEAGAEAHSAARPPFPRSASASARLDCTASPSDSREAAAGGGGAEADGSAARGLLAPRSSSGLRLRAALESAGGAASAVSPGAGSSSLTLGGAAEQARAGSVAAVVR